jgi:hypothetical protein
MQLVYRFPYQRQIWHSALAPDEARAVLSAQLADVPFYRSAGSRPLRGRFEGERFRCSRVIGYRNFFLPVVTGRLSPEGQGTRVELLFRAPIFASAFLGVWTLGIVAVVLGIVSGRATGEAARLGAFTLPLLAIGIAIAGFAFGSEALETEHLLKRCLRVSTT